MNQLIDRLRTFLIAVVSAGALYTTFILIFGTDVHRPQPMEPIYSGRTEQAIVTEQEETAEQVVVPLTLPTAIDTQAASDEIRLALEAQDRFDIYPETIAALPTTLSEKNNDAVEPEPSLATLALSVESVTDMAAEIPVVTPKTTTGSSAYIVSNTPTDVAANLPADDSLPEELTITDPIAAPTNETVNNFELESNRSAATVVHEPVDFFDIPVNNDSTEPLVAFSTETASAKNTTDINIINNESFDFIPVAISSDVETAAEVESANEVETANIVESTNEVEQVVVKIEEPTAATEEPVEEESAAENSTVVSIDELAVPYDTEESASGNSVWFVDSCRATSDPETLRFWRLVNTGFEAADLAAFSACDVPNVPTVIVIHGNLSDCNAAVRTGMIAVNRLRRLSAQRNIENGFRLVIWKWPSEKMIKGIRPDSQFKASLADINGAALAGLLSTLRSENRVTLIGFSFGARVAGSALTHLGCETLNAERGRCSLILLGAAANRGDFSSYGKYAASLSLLDQIMNVYNPHDKALKFYPLLYRGHHVPAIGVSPMAAPCASAVTVRSINASIYGAEHNFSNYLNSIADSYLCRLIFGQASEPIAYATPGFKE